MSDTFVTNVPSVTYGPNGIVLPTENAIVVGVLADLNSAFGGNLNTQLSTPQGQLATSEAAAIGDANAIVAWLFNQFDPAQNSGRMQDAVGRIYFMTRIAAQPTVQPCVCTGLATTPIPVGALAIDPNTGIQWICTQAGAIGSGGTVTLDFSCVTSGPVTGPTSLNISQVPAGSTGWESITPTGDAVLGRLVETASEFETRRQQSVAANANQILDAIQGQVLAVDGVLDCYAIENDSPSAGEFGGVELFPNSVYVCVLGGTTSDVAYAMWLKKGPGCAWNGNTSVIVTDPNPAYNPPAPQYTVKFQTSTIVGFAVLVTITNSPGVPANALTLIQAKVISAFAGTDGGTRAKIGSLVYASRLYSGILSLGSWAQIVSIQIGGSGGAAIFTGSTSGAVLTVSAVETGTLAKGQLLQDVNQLMAPGTIIVQQLTGTTGGTGTYQISVAQTLASESMNATTLANDVQMNIDQAPAVSAQNIQLLLV